MSAKRRKGERFTQFEGDLSYVQHLNGNITIRVSGKIAENLNRAARAMNGCSWTCNDNTAATLIADFILRDTAGNLHEDAPHYKYGGLSDELNLISEMIYTGTDDKGLEMSRIEELDDAFRREFGIVDKFRKA